MTDPQRTHGSIIAVAIAISALAGAVAGGFTAVYVSGAARLADRLAGLPETPALQGDPNVAQTIGKLLEDESATISVVEETAPAVVSIVIKKPRSALRGGFSDGFFDPVFASDGGDDDDLIEIGGGTGFFVSEDGMIVTNRHVVNDEEAVYRVVTNDGAELDATVVARDFLFDIAILDVEGDGYPTAVLGDSEKIRIGQTAIAIGNTLSEYRNTVTKGVISGIDRRVVAGDAFGGDEVIDGAIQTDAAINPGNSGGPLIDLIGQVVGVNTATSFEGESVGFAIPINDVRKIVEDIRQYGRIVRPWIGVRYVAINEIMAREEGLAYDTGALLVGGLTAEEAAVLPESPADKAGLKEGDIILRIDGTDISEEHTLSRIISGYRPGDVIKLLVARGDETLELDLTLAEADPESFR